MPFDPDVTSKAECRVTTFQDGYFYTETFEEAKEKMRFNSSQIKLADIKCYLIDFRPK